MNNVKKELKRIYKEKKHMIGLYSLSFENSETLYIGISKNLDKVFNKHIFQLKVGSHICKQLQSEFNSYGENLLKFEIIEEIDSDDINPMLLDDVLKSKKEKWTKKLFVIEI